MDSRGKAAVLEMARRMGGDFVSGLALMVVLLVTGNIFLATGLGIAAGIAQIVWLKLRGRPVEPMQWGVLALVAVLGTATFITRDPRFVMAKLSIFMGGVGLLMLKPGWPSRYMPAAARERVPPSAVVVLGYVWAAAMFGVAIANLVVAHYASLRVWAVFSAFAPWTVVAILMAAPPLLFRRRAPSQVPAAPSDRRAA